MTQTNQDRVLDSLIQNYKFKSVKTSKLPTIDYVYPDYIAYGNSEMFRFNSELRRELSDRAYLVRIALKEKCIAYTREDSILLEVGNIAPRLGLEEQITGKINSIYAYAPLLFVAVKGSDFVAYVVKPVIDGHMAWFELTKEEQSKLKDNLTKKSEAKPYRNLVQRILSKPCSQAKD